MSFIVFKKVIVTWIINVMNENREVVKELLVMAFDSRFSIKFSVNAVDKT